ncbi:TPA: hypothetical protein K8M77_000284 [Clostridium perfringens]|nr:hypothetical protein [Clostridium perfringens]
MTKMDILMKQFERKSVQLAGAYMELEGCSVDEALQAVMEFVVKELNEELEWVGELLCK